MDAVDFSLPGNSGYVIGGVGWTFVPTSALLVTGIAATAPQVSLWQGTNQIIANYDCLGAWPYNFQSITPLLLSAGQRYAISAQNSNFTSEVDFMVYGPPGGSVYDPPPFNLSPYISQFASYLLSSTGQWSPMTPPPNNTNYLGFGPNFQFQVVPSLTISQSSSSVVVSWPYPSNGWTLQQNVDLSTTNWTASGYTISNDGTNNNITIMPPTGNLFFRLTR
jgi:hypothetical protein